ncbi:hypothetical protein [Streptomyces lancefieldiae]|uniref:Uncharacterized protein n=1 Tax=Streptomyces lancefieldiae TaxID=3075520 RepID=A0ABU3AFI6_9ACTN|nr:hypothetical protein [Streptomyces sp. DSM 40712]MDT0608688.1 hypothetical protein [Streptomyces sp. DSM 40712]
MSTGIDQAALAVGHAVSPGVIGFRTRGLDAYGEDGGAVHFGREAQAAELTRRLHASAPAPSTGS